MAGNRCAIYEAQAIKREELLILGIGQSALPNRRRKFEQTMRSAVPRRLNGFRKTENVARRAAQRRFGHEGAAALATRDQTFVG